MRYLLTIQYLGTRYAGWQSQTNATAIQDVVEGALAKMLPEPVRIEGASRTDSGVHAAGQRAHVDVSVDITPRGLVLGINDSLPGDIRVERPEFSFYFPIVTCLIVSVVLTILMRLLGK